MSRLERVLRLICWLGFVTAPSESQPGVDPDNLLALAAKRTAEALDRQRRFTCDATIIRERYRTDTSDSQPRARGTRRSQLRSLQWRDRVHVEIAVFDGRQLFSWPGIGVFRFEGLDAMTGGGASGSGDFGPFAASFLADSDPASLRFRGVGGRAGQRVAEYSYDVPLARSHYEINTGPHQFERTAYQGSAFVETQTGDLRRLVIRVPSPPLETGVLRAEVDTSYEPQPIAQGPGLFPSESTLTLILNGGAEAVNRTTYRGCRSFASESAIRFDTSDAAREPNVPAAQSRLPAGLEVRSTMLTPIDSRTASAGDLFKARLVDPVRQGKQTLVPKGAVLCGRLVEVEQQYSPAISVRLMLKFDSVEFDRRSVPIALAARPTLPTPNPLSSYNPGDWAMTRAKTDPEPEGQGGHVASIRIFGKDHVTFDTHTVMHWETQ